MKSRLGYEASEYEIKSKSQLHVREIIVYILFYEELYEWMII